MGRTDRPLDNRTEALCRTDMADTAGGGLQNCDSILISDASVCV